MHASCELQPIEGETLQKLDEGSMSSMAAGLLGGLSGDAPPVTEGTSLSGLDGGNFQLDGLMGGLSLESGASGAPPAPTVLLPTLLLPLLLPSPKLCLQPPLPMELHLQMEPSLQMDPPQLLLPLLLVDLRLCLRK